MKTSFTHKQFADAYLDISKKSGDEWLTLCPYHDDSSPSFSFNVAKGVFICYACHAKGTTSDLAKHLGVMSKTNITPIEISTDDVKFKIEKLLGDRSVVIPKPSLFHTLAQYRLGSSYLEQWAKRGITNPEVFDAFQLGYSSLKNCLTIPLWSKIGNLHGIIERTLDPVSSTNTKYKYPANTKITQFLFGFWQIRCLSMTSSIKRLAIVEGSIDALSMWEVGIPAVALLGSNLSVPQSKLIVALDPREVVVMTDMDAAGSRASFSIETQLRNTGIIVSRAKWDSSIKDPADLSPQERKNIFMSDN